MAKMIMWLGEYLNTNKNQKPETCTALPGYINNAEWIIIWLNINLCQFSKGHVVFDTNKNYLEILQNFKRMKIFHLNVLYALVPNVYI